jgi:CDP-glycerol glycerophosphotransferase (TagB/SpsB family)
VITTHPREVLYEGAKSQLAWAKIFQGDIHDILWSADALIGDVGSTTYDFAITGKPILLIKPIAENMFYDHPKWMLDYNTPVCIPETEDIHAKFEEACERAEKKNRNGRNDLQEVYRRSFYRPFEGNGTEFAARWIQETVKKLWLR